MVKDVHDRRDAIEDLAGLTGAFKTLERAMQDNPRAFAIANENAPNLTTMSSREIVAMAGDILKGPNKKQMLINALFALRASQRENVLSRMRLRDATHTIAEFKQLADDWKHIATTDHLTGSPNRYAFMMALEDMIKRYREEAVTIDNQEDLPHYAVAFIDIDKFKAINDTYGHEAGDLALKTLATRLGEITRSHEAFGRLSGDEFALLLMGDDSTENNFAERAKDRLQNEMKNLHIIYDGERININCSVGVEHVVDHTLSATALLKVADQAMYVEKRGKGVARAAELIPPVDPDKLENN